jgi:MtfA peptidase
MGLGPLGWLGRQWQARREAAAVARRAVPDDLWKRTLVRYPFLRRRASEDMAELRRLVSLFLDRKEFTAAGGVRLTDEIAVAVAAQACLPVLHLGLAEYGGFVGIVLHPDQVLAKRSVADDDGVVHEYDELLSGEAMEGGPVMLSWRDVRSAGRSAADAYNVVIHEFAHVLDQRRGLSGASPRLPADVPAREWRDLLALDYGAFTRRVDAGADTVLDPYGAEAPEEFFAVASEAFFVAPRPMKKEHPALYGVFSRFYRQDPGAESV